MNEDNNQKVSPTDRADELLARAGETVGLIAGMVGVRLARVAAFAREEAEDLWAEAQSVRRQSAENLSRAADKATVAIRRDPEQPEGTREEGVPSGGRVTADATNTLRTEPEESKPQAEQDAGPGGETVAIDATPAARRHAEELGVDLRQAKGSGPDGRISVSDVRKAARHSP
jgi:pyruvate/2-oxoglutarate dehydrogenase complex dihydrolipoamide acyltransferase (E2) component